MIFYNSRSLRGGSFVKNHAMRTVHNRLFSIMTVLLMPAAMFGQGGHSVSSPNKNKDHMNITHNKEVIRRLYEESLNKAKLDILHEFVSEDYTGPRGEKGPAGFASNIAPLIKAFPGIKWTITELVGEGDKVMINWKWEGTHQEQYLHIPATHIKVVNTALAVYDLKDGKIIGARLQTDRLGFLQQLNMLPQDVTRIPAKETRQAQVRFIDKFVIPTAAREEFMKRTQINREFIKKLPGFIEDEMYISTDTDGNTHCVTVAVWENEEALQKAKEKVQEFYREDGFNPAEMLKRLHITMDRGVYSKIEE